MAFGEIVARRRKCAETTRDAMLCAAGQRFLAESYENVGLRDIARDVGVDVALVSRYFGSKEELFKEVLRAGKEEKFRIVGTSADLPAFFTSLIEMSDDDESETHIARLLIMLRSASSPTARKIVRDAVRDDVLRPIAALLDGEHEDARASLALAILLGVTMLKAIMSVAPDCELDRQVMSDRLLRLFETALAG